MAWVSVSHDTSNLLLLEYKQDELCFLPCYLSIIFLPLPKSPLLQARSHLWQHPLPSCVRA